MEFNNSPVKVKSFFDDKRLTLVEKKILQGYLLVRDNRNTEVLDLLDGIPASPHAFIEGQRNLLLGLAHNNLTHFEDSRKFILVANSYFKELSLPYFEFLGLFNLFIIGYNTQNLLMMKKSLDKLHLIESTGSLQDQRMLRVQFMYHTHVNNIEEAQKFSTLIEKEINKFKESDVISYLTNLFMFHLKNDRFQECQQDLERMKNFRKYHLSENFNFMKKLLDHFMYDTPIYEYSYFKSTPLLGCQFRVIQCLEENNLKTAKEFWEKLHAMSPHLYGPEFNYRGEKSLFSLCLDKYLKNKQLHSDVQIDDSSKINTFITLLRNHKNGLSKELLHELIWGQTLQNKNDLIKLAKLAYRAKHEKNLNIKSRKGSYLLDETDSNSDHIKKLG